MILSLLLLLLASEGSKCMREESELSYVGSISFEDLQTYCYSAVKLKLGPPVISLELFQNTSRVGSWMLRTRWHVRNYLSMTSLADIVTRCEALATCSYMQPCIF